MSQTPNACESFDAPELARRARDDEAWINRARSFRVRAEMKTTVSPAALEFCSKHADRTSCCGGRGGGGLASSGTLKLDLAFDQRRAYRRIDNLDGDRAGTFRVRTWDGTRAVVYDHIGRNHDRTVRRPGPQFMSGLFGHLPWPRAAAHPFWFEDPRHIGDEFYFGRPDTFTAVGTEDFRGVDCRVIDSPVAWRRMFIGVADGRLYGITKRARPRSSRDRNEQVLRELAKEQGKSMGSADEYAPWFMALPRDVQDHWQVEHARRLEPSRVRYVDFWYADHRELAAGCRLPMRMGIVAWEIEAEEPFVSWERDVTVLEATVDSPLPDELFATPRQSSA